MDLKFKHNLSTTDRILRAGIGLGAMYFGFYSHYLITDREAALVLGSIGLISLLVALAGNCPVYRLIDFSSLKQEMQTPR